jgi:hypothetical protein
MTQAATQPASPPRASPTARPITTEPTAADYLAGALGVSCEDPSVEREAEAVGSLAPPSGVDGVRLRAALPTGDHPVNPGKVERRQRTEQRLARQKPGRQPASLAAPACDPYSTDHKCETREAFSIRYTPSPTVPRRKQDVGSPSDGPKCGAEQRFRWSAWVWSPPPESNRRPHPYHGTTGNRCAERRSPRSRPTVGAEVIGSLPAKLCALFHTMR